MTGPGVMSAPRWVGVPQPGDPRWRVAAILLAYVVLGITVLGFNRSPAQVATTVAPPRWWSTCCCTGCFAADRRCFR
jgi:hypothetical protein